MIIAIVLALSAAVQGTVRAQAPPSQASPAVERQLQAFDLLQKQRLAAGLTKENERQWADLRRRERELLAAAVNASQTDDDLRAVFYAAVGQHSDMALDVARRALKQRTSPEWWHHTGIAASAFSFSGYVGDPQKTELLNEAKRAVLDGLEMKPDSWVWLLAGQILDALYEWPAAKRAFSVASTAGMEERDRPLILRGLWRSTSALNEMAEADKYWAEFLKTGAVTDQDSFDRANHLASIGRFSEGARIATVLAQNPQQRTGLPAYRLWYWVTYAHWKAAEDKSAVNAAGETVRSSPDTPEARRYAAMAATIAASIGIDVGDFKGAQEFVTFAISADPAFASSYTQLAKIHFAAKRLAEAEREVRRALSLVTGPESEAYYVLAKILGAQNRWAEAGQAFEEAGKVESANPYPMLNAGVSYENAGRYADAIRCYEETLRRGPNIKERDSILAAIAKLKRV